MVNIRAIRVRSLTELQWHVNTARQAVASPSHTTLSFVSRPKNVETTSPGKAGGEGVVALDVEEVHAVEDQPGERNVTLKTGVTQ